MGFKLMCMGLGLEVAKCSWGRVQHGEDWRSAPACPGSCHHGLRTSSLPYPRGHAELRCRWSHIRATESLVLLGHQTSQAWTRGAQLCKLGGPSQCRCSLDGGGWSCDPRRNLAE